MKKIVFDLDNTLLFLSQEWKDAYQRVIDKYRLNVTSEELFAAIGEFDYYNKEDYMTKKAMISLTIYWQLILMFLYLEWMKYMNF